MTLPQYGQQIAKIDEALLDALVAAGVATEGQWESVANQDIAEGTTEVSVEGLDGDTDNFYVFYLALRENGAAAANVYVTLNSDSTGTPYTNQILTANGGTVSGTRGNVARPRVGFISSGETAVIHGMIYARRTGQRRGIIATAAQAIAGGSLIVRTTAASWSNTADNVISIQFGLDSGGEFEAGARLFVLKPKQAA